MKRIYCLSTCDKCQAIIKTIDAKKKGFALQDIKTEKITSAQLDDMKELAGSYEALFSRRALLYRERGLAAKKLAENDFRDLILEEYTFLKRPVVILDRKIFVGSEKKTVEDLLNDVTHDVRH
ncbi:MAG TPA: ArsC/Spx/MgsR family protein [Puia sp.]|nr:ArsC/Spx/MgsR family protein [Puia sp.]